MLTIMVPPRLVAVRTAALPWRIATPRPDGNVRRARAWRYRDALDAL
jgi:hypothetical protein